jgi:hypothetical protein
MSFNSTWGIAFKKINMKKILLSVLTSFISCMLFAKTVDTIPEPEFMNEIYYYDKATVKLTPLEKAKAEMKTKMKIMGGSTAYAINGEKSPTRITPAGGSFIIALSGGSMMDPAMTIGLYRLDSRKGRREAPMGQYGGSQRTGGSTLEIKFKRVKDNTYEIIVPEILGKGEYGFINMHSMSAAGGMTTYAFGVD